MADHAEGTQPRAGILGRIFEQVNARSRRNAFLLKHFALGFPREPKPSASRIRPAAAYAGAMSAAIRPYNSRDFAKLFRIDQACYPPGIAYSKNTLRWFLNLPGAKCLVAEVSGKIAG